MTGLRYEWLVLAAGLVLALGCDSQREAAREDASLAEKKKTEAGPDGALKYYLMAQEALADDRFEPARQALAELQEHMDPEQSGLAGAAAAAVDLGTLRAAFLPLSNALLDLELPGGYRIAHCPMAFDYEGAHWIQKDGEIANPYYGAGMLNCGVFVERRASSEDPGN